MSVYLDASVLVPIFVDDDWTDQVSAWLQTEPPMVVSDWAVTEFSSALSLHVRRGRLESGERDAAENALNRWFYQSVERAEVDGEDIISARRLLHRHVKLRAPDALHMAIVMRLGLAFATYDGDLAEAATREGVKVIAP